MVVMKMDQERYEMLAAHINSILLMGE